MLASPLLKIKKGDLVEIACGPYWSTICPTLERFRSDFTNLIERFLCVVYWGPNLHEEAHVVIAHEGGGQKSLLD